MSRINLPPYIVPTTYISLVFDATYYRYFSYFIFIDDLVFSTLS